MEQENSADWSTDLHVAQREHGCSTRGEPNPTVPYNIFCEEGKVHADGFNVPTRYSY